MGEIQSDAKWATVVDLKMRRSVAYLCNVQIVTIGPRADAFGCRLRYYIVT